MPFLPVALAVWLFWTTVTLCPGDTMQVASWGTAPIPTAMSRKWSADLPASRQYRPATNTASPPADESAPSLLGSHCLPSHLGQQSGILAQCVAQLTGTRSGPARHGH